MVNVFVRRKIYSVASWNWLLCACMRHRSLLEMAELTRIILKEERQSKRKCMGVGSR